MTNLNGEAGRERGEEGAGGLDPELVRMGCAYLSALNLIGQLRKLAVSDPRYWDHFCGCVFCKSHIDRGHVEGCLLVESQKALLRYDDERRSGSASAEPQRAFGPIREALSQLEIAAGALREIQGDHESRYNAIALLHLLKAKSALLGEAPPTKEAEQSQQTNPGETK